MKATSKLAATIVALIFAGASSISFAVMEASPLDIQGTKISVAGDHPSQGADTPDCEKKPEDPRCKK